jgi:hypothetical protein
LCEYDGVVRCERLELVLCAHEGQTCELGYPRGNELGELGLAVEPGAYRGAALRQRIKLLERGIEPCSAVPDLRRIARELLAERQRRCVLSVGAADLDDMGELFAFFSSASCRCSAGMSRCAISSTAAICIAVGKQSFEDWLILTWSLGCTGVFCPRFPPCISFARDAITSLTFILVWMPDPVCHTIDEAQRANDRRGHALLADAEIAAGTFGLRSPKSIGRHLDGAERVTFGAPRYASVMLAP